MKYRVCGKKTPGSNQAQNLKPFFEVDVQLQNQEVILSPSLVQIQTSINKAATAVLRCSKALYNWDQSDKEQGQKATFYDMIAQDKEIVKVILLLTGSIQGTKNQVGKFLARFEKYDKLCKDSISNSIKKFNAKKDGPTL
jgi:dynein heavy chain